MINNAREKS